MRHEIFVLLVLLLNCGVTVCIRESNAEADLQSNHDGSFHSADESSTEEDDAENNSQRDSRLRTLTDDQRRARARGHHQASIWAATPDSQLANHLLSCLKNLQEKTEAEDNAPLLRSDSCSSSTSDWHEQYDSQQHKNAQAEQRVAVPPQRPVINNQKGINATLTSVSPNHDIELVGGSQRNPTAKPIEAGDTQLSDVTPTQRARELHETLMLESTQRLGSQMPGYFALASCVGRFDCNNGNEMGDALSHAIEVCDHNYTIVWSGRERTFLGALQEEEISEKSRKSDMRTHGLLERINDELHSSSGERRSYISLERLGALRGMTNRLAPGRVWRTYDLYADGDLARSWATQYPSLAHTDPSLLRVTTNVVNTNAIIIERMELSQPTFRKWQSAERRAMHARLADGLKSISPTYQGLRLMEHAHRNDQVQDNKQDENGDGGFEPSTSVDTCFDTNIMQIILARVSQLATKPTSIIFPRIQDDEILRIWRALIEARRQSIARDPNISVAKAIAAQDGARREPIEMYSHNYVSAAAGMRGEKELYESLKRSSVIRPIVLALGQGLGAEMDGIVLFPEVEETGGEVVSVSIVLKTLPLSRNAGWSHLRYAFPDVAGKVRSLLGSCCGGFYSYERLT